MKQALVAAAKYVHLYEQHSEKLAIHDPEIYRIFSAELLSAAGDETMNQWVRHIAFDYPTVQELRESLSISSKIRRNRAYFYPELEACLARMVAA